MFVEIGEETDPPPETFVFGLEFILRNYTRVLPENSTVTGFQPRYRCPLAILTYVPGLRVRESVGIRGGGEGGWGGRCTYPLPLAASVIPTLVSTPPPPHPPPPTLP